MKWLKARRLEKDTGPETQREHKMLAYSLVHPAADGSVLLESGAPMTDGSTAYLIWVRIADDAVGGLEDAHEPYSTQWYDGGDHLGSGPLGRYEGRWYVHAYDDGGLRSAKHSGEQAAKEAAP